MSQEFRRRRIGAPDESPTECSDGMVRARGGRIRAAGRHRRLRESALRGAVNYIEVVEDFLMGRLSAPRIEMLCDEEATRSAVACRSDQRATEIPFGPGVHGVFTHSLLGALRTLEPTATYRELVATAG